VDNGSLVDNTYGVGQPLGGFMDAMANPMAAGGYTPGNMTSTHSFEDAMANPSLAGSYDTGILDGWTGDALQGAAFGALTGGLPGAVLGGVVGGFNPFGHAKSLASNAFGGLFGGSPDGSMMVSNGRGGWRSADALDAMSNPDLARSMFGRGGFVSPGRLSKWLWMGTRRPCGS
jgi:hypothetical protein